MALPSLQSDNFDSSFDKYIYSPWMLPTVLLTYGIGEFLVESLGDGREALLMRFIVVLLDNVLINYVHKVIIHRTESNV